MVEIHSSQSGKLLRSLFIHRSREDTEVLPRSCSVAFSANEAHIVCIVPRTGIIIHTGTGQIVKKFEFNVFDYLNLEISPNSKYIVSNDEKKGVKVWDIDTGEAVDGKWLDCFPDVAVFPNSEQIITADKTTGEFNFWDISTGNKTAMPTLYYSRVKDVQQSLPTFVSNDKYLVVLSGGGIVEIWSLETHQRVSQHRTSSQELCTSLAKHPEVVPFDVTIQERTVYALEAWKKALFSESSEMNLDGWVLGPNRELLFWVPDDQRRHGLWRPKMAHLMGAPITKLIFDNFVHGSRWTECKENLQFKVVNI